MYFRSIEYSFAFILFTSFAFVFIGIENVSFFFALIPFGSSCLCYVSIRLGYSSSLFGVRVQCQYLVVVFTTTINSILFE